MQLARVLEILIKLFAEILAAEELHPVGHGAEKRERVLAWVAPEVSRRSTTPIGVIDDMEELLALVGEIVDLVVKLLNMLGVFATTPAEPQPADVETEV